MVSSLFYVISGFGSCLLIEKLSCTYLKPRLHFGIFHEPDNSIIGLKMSALFVT